MTTASEHQKQFSFVLSALNGKADALRRMVQLGVNVNAPSADLYSHGTPLHHAVCSGSLEAVEVLVEAGAELDRKDNAWAGTPLGWAEHYLSEWQGDRRGKSTLKSRTTSAPTPTSGERAPRRLTPRHDARS